MTHTIDKVNLILLITLVSFQNEVIQKKKTTRRDSSQNVSNNSGNFSARLYVFPVAFIVC